MIDREKLNAALGMSEEEMDALGLAYETDAWDSSSFGKPTMGRPRVTGEETKPITVRLPISQIVAIDMQVAERGGTRSSAVRDAVSAWLRRASAL